MAGTKQKPMKQQNEKPLIPASVSLAEITPRAVIIGIILTVILAAANAFLGLKVGSTVSASIPAAVISMGILRFFKDSNVLENTMVQIMASVGESLTAGVAYILPALLILHVWNIFNYWQTVIVSLIGGGLGVIFTIPLRRALLQDKSLRYPEAIAIANVLKASASHEKSDLKALIQGGIVGATIALFQSGFQILTDYYQYWVKTSSVVFGFGIGLSPALIAAGYIVGLNVGLSLLVGILLGWIIGIPILTLVHGLPLGQDAQQIASIMWRTHIRYMGVGTMLIGGVWTLSTLFKPVLASMSASMSSLRDIRRGKKAINIRTERDIPINYVFISAALMMIPLFLIIAYAIIPPGLQISIQMRFFISGFSTLYVLIGGFVFCSIMAYFAGLIGSTNSPVSGLLVSALLVICMIFILFFAQTDWSEHTKQTVGSIVAIGSMVVIAGALSISNDTMQDLKVGQLVGATPWKQQTMLILGVIVTAFVVPPILQLLYNAYGIGGVFPRPNMSHAHMLAAPQAGLMATVAKGAFTSQLEWNMIGIGATIAVICIIIDEFLKKSFRTRLPVLAVGLGIYLPLEASVPVIIGGILGYIIKNRLNKVYTDKQKNLSEKHIHRGLLLSCGLVAGASLMGVALAIPFALRESADALKIMPNNCVQYSGILGVIVTTVLCAWMYHTILKKEK